MDKETDGCWEGARSPGHTQGWTPGTRLPLHRPFSPPTVPPPRRPSHQVREIPGHLVEPTGSLAGPSGLCVVPGHDSEKLHCDTNPMNYDFWGQAIAVTHPHTQGAGSALGKWRRRPSLFGSLAWPPAPPGYSLSSIPAPQCSTAQACPLLPAGGIWETICWEIHDRMVTAGPGRGNPRAERG